MNNEQYERQFRSKRKCIMKAYMYEMKRRRIDLTAFIWVSFVDPRPAVACSAAVPHM